MRAFCIISDILLCVNAPTPESCGTVTRLLAEVRAGIDNADDRLFRHVQADLRKLAQSMLNRYGVPSRSLEGTELVNLAVARLLDREELTAEDRRHFFFLLGRAMQHVIVEEARWAQADKREGKRTRVPLVEFVVDEERVAVSPADLAEALAALARQDPQAADVLRLRFYSGCSLEQTREALGVSLHDVREIWKYSRAWLFQRLGEPGPGENS